MAVFMFPSIWSQFKINLLLQIFDGLFTYHVLTLGVPELNPLVRNAIYSWGEVWGLVYWVAESDFPGFLFLGGLVLAVLGLQGFILALVGESLGRIQREVEGRPLYAIEREL